MRCRLARLERTLTSPIDESSSSSDSTSSAPWSHASESVTSPPAASVNAPASGLEPSRSSTFVTAAPAPARCFAEYVIMSTLPEPGGKLSPSFVPGFCRKTTRHSKPPGVPSATTISAPQPPSWPDGNGRRVTCTSPTVLISSSLYSRRASDSSNAHERAPAGE